MFQSLRQTPNILLAATVMLLPIQGLWASTCCCCAENSRCAGAEQEVISPSGGCCCAVGRKETGQRQIDTSCGSLARCLPDRCRCKAQCHGEAAGTAVAPNDDRPAEPLAAPTDRLSTARPKSDGTVDRPGAGSATRHGIQRCIFFCCLLL